VADTLKDATRLWLVARIVFTQMPHHSGRKVLCRAASGAAGLRPSTYCSVKIWYLPAVRTLLSSAPDTPIRRNRSCLPSIGGVERLYRSTVTWDRTMA
jgi:hypothetical protein